MERETTGHSRKLLSHEIGFQIKRGNWNVVIDVYCIELSFFLSTESLPTVQGIERRAGHL
jgi:hypothetical protein